MKYDKPKIVLYNLKGYNEINTKENDSFVVKEIISLEKTIKDNGYEIVPCSYRWPRDLYVKYDILIPRYKFNELGEGGLIVQGKDFVLISSKVKKKLYDLKDFEEHEQINYDYNNKENNSKIVEDYKKLVKNRGIKFYLNEDQGIKFKDWLNHEESQLFKNKKIYDKVSLIQFTTGKKTPGIEALMYLLNKKSKN